MVIVSALSGVVELARRYQPEYLVSIAAIPERPSCIGADKHITLNFSDIDKPVPQNRKYAAQPEHIARIIDLANNWSGTTPALFNCRQGHRRSPTAAYIFLCAKFPGKKVELFTSMLDKAPYFYPNQRMLELAEKQFGWEGELTALAAAMRPTQIPPKGCYFTLPCPS